MRIPPPPPIKPITPPTIDGEDGLEYEKWRFVYGFIDLEQFEERVEAILVAEHGKPI